MQAITVRDRDAGVGGLTLTDMPYPHAGQNDVVVRVHAAGFTPGELDWPTTWVDRAGRDRTPSVPGHELSGVVVELGYGTTGLTVGQRVFGLTDWARNGTLAEYTAVEARNLAPLPADVDHSVAAAVPISGLTAWQALIDHAGLTTGQTVLVHGAAGGVGSIAVQLAREVGAVVIGTGRAADRDTAVGLGVNTFLDLQADKLEAAGEVDVVFDVIGGEILDRSAALVRPGGTLVTIARVPSVQPKDGRAVFFVVEPDRSRLADLAQRLRDGRLKPIVGAVRPLAEAPAAFAPAGAPPARRSSGSPKTDSRTALRFRGRLLRSLQDERIGLCTRFVNLMGPCGSRGLGSSAARIMATAPFGNPHPGMVGAVQASPDRVNFGLDMSAHLARLHMRSIHVPGTGDKQLLRTQ
jgi:NADPH:quinone reductase-like Zn-dependent oxidoreductase